MTVHPLPRNFRLTLDLTRQEAQDLITVLPKGTALLSRLLDDLEEITTFDRTGEDDE